MRILLGLVRMRPLCNCDGDTLPSASSRAIKHTTMRRFRALLLLGSLLTTPVGIMAAVVFPSSTCCCCGTTPGAMCPMHRNTQSRQEKMPCQGAGQSKQCCMCASNPQVQPMIPQFTPNAAEVGYEISFLPSIANEVLLRNVTRLLIRSVSPPEEPPRQ